MICTSVACFRSPWTRPFASLKAASKQCWRLVIYPRFLPKTIFNPSECASLNHRSSLGLAQYGATRHISFIQAIIADKRLPCKKTHEELKRTLTCCTVEHRVRSSSSPDWGVEALGKCQTYTARLRNKRAIEHAAPVKLVV